jgi:hypothetical protein
VFGYKKSSTPSFGADPFGRETWLAEHSIPGSPGARAAQRPEHDQRPRSRKHLDIAGDILGDSPAQDARPAGAT